MQLKKEGSLEELGNEFNNELLNYADYLTRARETKKLREMFLQRAIITNDPGMVEPEVDDDIDFEKIDDLDDDYLDDPEAIAIPWEEKYGDEKEEKAAEEKNEDKPKQ
jgi:hypothetical protein